MGKGQAVAWNAHEQMVLAVIIDPIRRNRRALPQPCISGAGMGEWVIAAGGGAGMLGDIADAQEQLECRRQCQQVERIGQPSPDQE